MADHIIHSEQIKISKPTIGVSTAGLARDQKGTALQSRAHQPGEMEIYSSQPETLPADNSTPLYSSRIINTYIEFLAKFYPEVDNDTVLRQAGITRHEVEDPGHWFTQRQVDSFHETLVAKTGNPKIAREAGRFTVSSARVGAAKQYALGSINLVSIYLKIGKLAAAMSRGAVMTAQRLGANKIEIVARPTPGTIEKPHQCENRIGTLEGVAKLVTKKFAEMEHLACIHKGDDCCRYILTWEKTAALTWKRISHFMPLIGLLICLTFFPFISGQASIIKSPHILPGFQQELSSCGATNANHQV